MSDSPLSNWARGVSRYTNRRLSHTVRDPLIVPGAAERARLWEQMKLETYRLAICVWHCGYSKDDAWLELRTFTAYAAEQGKYRVKCGELAGDMLDEALADLEQSYARTVEKMKAVALVALQCKQPRLVVEMQAAAVAATADPQPPVHLVRFAIHGAWRLHHWRLKHAGKRVAA